MLSKMWKYENLKEAGSSSEQKKLFLLTTIEKIRQKLNKVSKNRQKVISGVETGH